MYCDLKLYVGCNSVIMLHIAPAEQYRTKKTDTVGTHQGSNGVSSSRIPEKKLITCIYTKYVWHKNTRQESFFWRPVNFLVYFCFLWKASWVNGLTLLLMYVRNSQQLVKFKVVNAIIRICTYILNFNKVRMVYRQRTNAYKTLSCSSLNSQQRML